MKNKEGEFVYLDDDGAEWVRYEYFQKINTIALESKLIIERIQMLLGVYTTTEALARIVELQASNAAQQSVQADVPYVPVKHPFACPECGRIGQVICDNTAHR